jgi:nitrate/TMAO reductase-like tetraheme cytochrome c subunit
MGREETVPSFPCEQSLAVLEATTENILLLLGSRSQEEPSEYNYESRKRIIQRKAELKQKLLERYCLHELTQEDEANEMGQAGRKYRERKREGGRSRITRKKGVSHTLENMRERCIRKLYSVARRSFSTQDCSMKRTCL